MTDSPYGKLISQDEGSWSSQMKETDGAIWSTSTEQDEIDRVTKMKLTG